MKLIDADYLIDTIGAMIGYGTTPTDIWDMVNDAPTIDAVSVVHGEWKHDGSVWTYRFNCTNCGYHLLGKQTNYCPYCGARMKGVDDEV